MKRILKMSVSVLSESNESSPPLSFKKSLLPINGWVFLFFPLLMRVLYFIIGQVYQFLGTDYKYMDGECLLKMVNETNTVHFSKHPVWSYRSYESSCNNEEYWIANIQDAKWESVMLQIYMKSGMILGLLACMYRLPNWKKLFPWALICFVGAETAIITAHYQSDITHRGGATEHHANMKHVDFNRTHFATFGTATRTIIPHLAATFFAAYLSMINDKNQSETSNAKGKQLFQRFFNSQNGFLAYLKINIFLHNMWVFSAPVILHKVIHQLGRSPVPDCIEFFLRAYDHVEYHHTITKPISGFTFGTFGTFSAPYDGILVLHGKLYEKGWIQKLNLSEYIADFIFDMLLFYMMFQYMNITNIAMQKMYGSMSTKNKRIIETGSEKLKPY